MNSIDKITVYLGSSGRCRQIFKDTAKEMGHLIGATGKTLVYGGMDSGLMGIVANGALEAQGKVTGIIPKSLKDSERIHPSLTETILVQDLWERKRKMFKRADAIITMAGGFGTIDEVLEAFYWADLGSHAKPIVFVNTDNYWDGFITFIRSLPDFHEQFIIVASTPQEAIEKIGIWTLPTIEGDPENLPHFEEQILQETAAPIIIKHATVAETYKFATAVGLKQLGRHDRSIGLLNTQGQFDGLLEWIAKAQTEHFITDRCTQLFSVDSYMNELKKKLSMQRHIEINLETEKWGPSETKTHIEIREKR
jgi:uncharacterized protein (TIGR00730 family)